jgi:hypothetical protein
MYQVLVGGFGGWEGTMSISFRPYVLSFFTKSTTKPTPQARIRYTRAQAHTQWIYGRHNFYHPRDLREGWGGHFYIYVIKQNRIDQWA